MYNKDVSDALHCINKQCNKNGKADNKIHFFGLNVIRLDTYAVNFCSKSGLWKFESPIFPL